jgi:FAD/FMN-containing dehydrogenase
MTAGAVVALPSRSFASFYHVLGQDPGDLEAVTGDNRKIVLKAASLRDLSAATQGRLLVAKSPGYDVARQILNPSIDKHPALIIQPVDTDGIKNAVAFARANDLLLAVKCGGHSTSGQSTCDRGMMIDLSGFRGVRVDPAARKAWVKGGTLLGQIDRETQAQSLATPLGTVSHTGVGGLTTGGGFGRVARRFGLALDNVAAVDVVTADGKLVHAGSGENEELLWAVRGGGGNFGVVTSFEFQLHPMEPRIIGGNVAFPLARAREVLSFYADYAGQAADDLYVDLSMMRPPGDGAGAINLHVCYSGPPAGADRALAPIRKLGTPLTDGIGPMEYVAIQRSTDISDPRAHGFYLKAGFISKLPAELISAILTGFTGNPGRMTELYFQHCGGAIARVPAAATAFAHRQALHNMIVTVAWRMGDDPTEHVRWIKQYWASLEPFTRGFYVNDAGDATAAKVNENYGGNYPRLAVVKKKYDPTNLFRLNANIQPGP